MSAKTTYLEDELIDHVLRNAAYSSPTTVYVGLYTAMADGEAGTGTEVSGGSYARQVAVFDAPTDGVTQNTSLITFPAATAGWSTVTHFALLDAVSGGNMLYYGTLTASRTVLTDDVLSIPVGDLTVTEL